MKYIDSEKLKAKIKGLQCEQGFEDGETERGYQIAIKDILRAISSLQQEQPENWNDKCREDEPQTRFAFYTYEDEDGVLYLSNVFVEEISRNKGFGTKILTAAEKVAETIGATTIRLKVKRNSQANDWYRKNGYGYLTFEGEYDWLEKNLEYLKPKQEQPEVDLEKFTDKIKTFQGRYKHPEILSIKGAMAFMARMFYQYPNVARQWYDSLPKATMD